MFLAQATGILLALGAAVAWGGADFSGGLASRRADPIRVLALSRVAAVLSYGVLMALSREPLPSPTSVAWGAAAGMAGALGLAMLYRGLAAGYAALVVPISGVIGAAIPVTFAAIIAGTLPVVQQLGLLTALVGIFLVSRASRSDRPTWVSGLTLGMAAGVGFGGFFVCLAQVEPGWVFGPALAAGCASFLVAALLLLGSRARFPSPRRHPVALLAGLLDATGVWCYLVATQTIRLDVAAVLGSFYPAVTLLLFWGILKERVSRVQWIGLTVCLVAIALIAR